MTCYNTTLTNLSSASIAARLTVEGFSFENCLSRPCPIIRSLKIN